MERKLLFSHIANRYSERILLFIQVTLFALYLYSSLVKILNLNGFHNTLLKSPMFDSALAGILVYTVPIWEILICGLIVNSKTYLLGYFASFFTMVCFTIYLTLIYTQFPLTPCSCGGVINSLSYEWHIALNLFFASLSIVAISLKK
jgi:hypothetical protein